MKLVYKFSVPTLALAAILVAVLFVTIFLASMPKW